MATKTASTTEPIGLKEDNTFALHALLAYSTSVILIIFLGSRLQYYSLNLGLLVTEIAFIALPASIVLLVHRKAVDGKLFSIPRAKQFSLTAVIGGCVVAIAVYKGFATRKALVGVDTSVVDDVTGGISPILLVLLAPLCEELLFRPVIQNSLARQWHDRVAVLATAILFALFHLSLLRFAETFIIGIFAGIVFLKTRNVWCPIILHFLCNALGPVLWRNVQHLAFLLNPGTSIALACLALSGCYFLGGRSPVPLKGLRQRLRWAVFGTSDSLPTYKRARYVAPLTWGIVVSLIVLLGYGHSVMIHELGGRKFNSSYVVSEEDEWTVVSSSEIRARSELTISKSPEAYEDLIVQLPFQDATIQEVKLEDNDLPFTRLEADEYRVELSSHQDAVQSGKITVQWSFPVASLVRSESWGYITPLISLAPSDSFSLTLTIADGCGFRFIEDGAPRTQHLFRSTSDKPIMRYGSCGMGMERGNWHTGDN